MVIERAYFDVIMTRLSAKPQTQNPSFRFGAGSRQKAGNVLFVDEPSETAVEDLTMSILPNP